MPWCNDCSKFWNPTSLPPDGTCPTCGEIIADPPDTKVPWHFWLLVIALVVYLGWRVIQGFQWLVANGHTAIAIPLGVALAALIAWAAWWNWHGDDDDEEGDEAPSGEAPDGRAAEPLDTRRGGDQGQG